LVLSSVVVLFFAAGIAAGDTRTGEIVAASAQRFLVFYSGVFALVGLTMTVAAGLAATDRIVMSPGHRIVSQAVHRAIAFVAVAFLVTHIAMEVLVGKSAVIDSVIPFLARGRTFYVGVGTIASDLFILIIATGIARKHFAEKSRAVLWRVLHGTAYLAWPLSIVHGLAAGRHAKPYVSWSYGACMIAVGLALVLRSVATIRPRQAAVHAWPDQVGFPTPAAAFAAAQAYVLHNQQGSAYAALTGGMPAFPGAAQAALPAGPAAALPAGPAAMPSPVQQATQLTGMQAAMQQAAIQPAMQPAAVQPAIQPNGPGTPWPGTPWPETPWPGTPASPWEPAREAQWAQPPGEPGQWEHPTWEAADWKAAEWEARWQQPAQWAQTPPYGMAISPPVPGAQGNGQAQGQAQGSVPPDQPPVGWVQAPAHGMRVPPEPVDGPWQYQPLRPVPPDDPPTDWGR